MTELNLKDTTFDWVTIEGFIDFTNHQISENQIRWCLRSKKHNGLDEHVKTFGRRTYLNTQGFLKWFEENNK